MTELSHLIMAYSIGWVVGMVTMGFLVVHKINALTEQARAKIKKTAVEELNPEKWK